MQQPLQGVLVYRAYVHVVGKFQGAAGGVVRMTTYDVQSILHLGLYSCWLEGTFEMASSP